MSAPSTFVGELEAVPGLHVDVGYAARVAAGTDYSWVSPIIAGSLPATIPDVVVRPADEASLARCLGIAHHHRTPVTVRGRGTTNYGQCVPFARGLVVDTTDLDRVLNVAAGRMTVQAGATIATVLRAAADAGQEPLLHPSTLQSTIGGFVGGGLSGAGTIEHGSTRDGFVLAVRLLPLTERPEPMVVAGAACRDHVHTWGTTGVATEITIRLQPRPQRRAVLGSFAEGGAALAAARVVLDLPRAPRLLAVSDPSLVEHYPKDPAIPVGRYSLRALVHSDDVDTVGDAISRNVGVIESVRSDGEALLLALTNNHSTVRVMKRRPGLYHLRVRMPDLDRHVGTIRSIVPDAMLQLEGNRDGEHRAFTCRILDRFHGPAQVFETEDRLRAAGLRLRDDTHRWRFGGDVDRIRSLAPFVDPDRLLNPGKLPSETAA